MLRKRYLSLSAAFVSGFLLNLVVACKQDQPKVTVYISTPDKQGMFFFNNTNGQSGFVGYAETDKFVCLNPQDIGALLNYCGVQKQ